MKIIKNIKILISINRNSELVLIDCLLSFFDLTIFNEKLNS